jgi:DNA excision repair protein ERCC-5
VWVTDTSIWLNHFIKAMRDKKGNMISNAHIKGLFSRVCKMLYFGVRPVFVFDGATPLLKKNTTARRQRAKETSTKKVQQLAEKILLNQLQLQSLKELKKSIADGDKEAAKHLLEKLTAVNTKGLAAIGDDDVINIDDDDDEVIEEDRMEDEKDVIPLSEFVDQGEFDGLFGSEDEDDQAVVVEDSDDSSEEVADFLPAAVPVGATLTDQQLKDLNIDSESFQHLPDDIKRDVLAQLQQLQAHHRRSRVRQMLREGDLDARPDPNAFSDLQLANLIQRSRVTRKIQELTSSLSGNAERPIASSTTGRYILRKEGGSESSAALQRPDGSLVRLRSDGTVERVGSASSLEPTMHLDPITSASSVLQDPTRSGAFSTTPRKKEKGKIVESNIDSAADLKDSSRIKGVTIDLDDYEDEDDEFEADFDEQDEEEFIQAQIAALADSDEDVVQQQQSSSFSRRPTAAVIDDDDVEVVHIATRPPSAASLDIVIDTNIHEGEDIDFDKFTDAEPAQRPSPPTVPRKGSSSIVIELDDEQEDAMQVDTTPAPAQNDAPRVIAQPAPVEVDSVSDEEVNPVEKSVDEDDEVQVDDEFLDVEFDDQPAPERTSTPPPPPPQPIVVTIAPSIPETSKDNVDEQQRAAVPTISVTPAAPLPASPIQQHIIEPESVANPPLSPIEPAGVPESPHRAPQDAPSSDHMEVEHSSQPSINDSISSVMIIAPPSEVGPSENIGVSLDALNRSVQSNNEDIWPEQVENMERELQAEVGRMQSERRAQAGQAQGVTDEMIEDCKELLQLFGVPYVESPGEADAQCAILEKLGLVDGIVSDDSDIFLFGGNNVFRHAFDRRYHLELYSIKGSLCIINLVLIYLSRFSLSLVHRY